MCESHGLPFVVKGGGHSPGGASSIENGIVIDLSLMTETFVKADEKQVVAGGGALASHVIKAAAEYGLACGKLKVHKFFERMSEAQKGEVL